MLALITAILGLPSAINALLEEIKALRAQMEADRKNAEMAKIDQTEKQLNDAKTSDEKKAAAAAIADTIRKL